MGDTRRQLQEEACEALVATANGLNSAIALATDSGLEVELEIEYLREVGKADRPLVRASARARLLWRGVVTEREREL